MNKQIPIGTEFVKLEQLLKMAGAVSTGGEAKQAIKTGKVRVNGEICLERGRKLRPGDRADYEDNRYEITRSDDRTKTQ